jgi:hypothetical protein
MSMVDNVHSEREDAFSPEEQQLFDAMQNGESIDTENLPQLPGGDEPGDLGDDNFDPRVQNDQFLQPEILPPGTKVQPQQPVQNDDGSPNDDPDVEHVVDQSGKKRGRVSYAKFAKIEQERAQLAQRLQELETKSLTESTRLNERLAIINEALATPANQQQTQQQAPEDPEPDPTVDIFAYSQWQGRQMKKLADNLNEVRTGLTRQEEERQYERTYTTDVNTFARAEPNFIPAVQHLANMRNEQLKIANPALDEAGRQRVIAAEERRLVQACLAEQKSPSQKLYELAKAYGYQPKTKEEIAAARNPGQQQPQQQRQQPQQRQPQGDPNALDNVARQPIQQRQQPQQQQRHLGPAADPNATIAAVRSGMEANQSLSQMGGGAPMQLTPDMVANMSEEEFAALTERLSEGKLRELLGD